LEPANDALIAEPDDALRRPAPVFRLASDCRHFPPPHSHSVDLPRFTQPGLNRRVTLTFSF
jgi:hypothetical protein